MNADTFWNKHLPAVVVPPEVITREKAKHIREMLRLTRKDVADGLGVSVGLVRKWESGERPINGYSERLMDFFIAEARKFSQKIEAELTEKKSKLGHFSVTKIACQAPILWYSNDMMR